MTCAYLCYTKYNLFLICPLLNLSHSILFALLSDFKKSNSNNKLLVHRIIHSPFLLEFCWKGVVCKYSVAWVRWYHNLQGCSELDSLVSLVSVLPKYLFKICATSLFIFRKISVYVQCFQERSILENQRFHFQHSWLNIELII